MTESIQYSPLRAELIEAGALRPRNSGDPTPLRSVTSEPVLRIDAAGQALAARRALRPESDIEAIRNSGFPGVDPRRTDVDRETKGLDL